MHRCLSVARAEEVLSGGESRLEYVRKFMKDFAEPKKFALLKQIFNSLPRKAKVSQ